jgi:hypothetical protein
MINVNLDEPNYILNFIDDNVLGMNGKYIIAIPMTMNFHQRWFR